MAEAPTRGMMGSPDPTVIELAAMRPAAITGAAREPVVVGIVAGRLPADPGTPVAVAVPTCTRDATVGRD
jgi:hypothetical protein